MLLYLETNILQIMLLSTPAMALLLPPLPLPPLLLPLLPPPLLLPPLPLPLPPPLILPPLLLPPLVPPLPGSRRDSRSKSPHKNNNNSPYKVNNENGRDVVRCDYLVVGAGTSGMSFVDTLLDQNPSATVVLVDGNAAPGGHWVHAYPFVRLHQSSASYGVNSLPLGRNRNLLGHERDDHGDRATGREIVAYYDRVRRKFEATGRVRCFFGVEYKHDETTGAHTIVRKDGGGSYEVECGKLVTVANDVTVPSMRGPLIPVDEGVHFVPINAVPSSVQSGKYNKYIVFGNGKTGADAIVELLESGVDQSRITWVVSRDVWYGLRHSAFDFYGSFPVSDRAFLKSKSIEKCFLSLERDGVIARIDPDGPLPDVTKGPHIDRSELDMLRSIESVVRLGRATSIDNGSVSLEQGRLDFSVKDTLLVDCMVDKLYGYQFDEDFAIFEPGRINLGPVTFIANTSLSSAHIAFLECALEDDTSKNDRCHFQRGRHAEPNREAMVGALYMHLKNANALKEVEGGEMFLLGSRTNRESPQHLRGGLLRFLWFSYGPEQGVRFGERLMEKIESGGYGDLDHCFGVEPSK